MSPRRAGQSTRATARRLALRAIGLIVALVLVTAGSALVVDPLSWTFVAIEAAACAALVLIDRVLGPPVDRWVRGAAGEEHVGEVIADLAGDGWLGIHDVDLGRGNVDHILVGPAGILTVETKSHRGRVAVDRVDGAMLRQAYAQAKAIERIVSQPVAPLLVFSRAFVDRPGAKRRGVTILPARMLSGHLGRRERRLSPEVVERVHATLVAALA